MTGTITNIFNWNFCLTDQTNRVKIIKEVYGIDVPRELEYTADYARYRWADIIATQYIDTTRPLVDFVSEALAVDDLLPTMEPTPEITPEPIPEFFDTTTPEPSPTDTATPQTGAANTDSTGVVRLSARNPLINEEYCSSIYSSSRELFGDFLLTLDLLEEAQAIARNSIVLCQRQVQRSQAGDAGCEGLPRMSKPLCAAACDGVRILHQQIRVDLLV
ncbi:MAG: hypothetical protein R2912_01325 [Eubacteriales bacterium]